MAKTVISTKRVAISKANAQMVGVVAAASFVTVFSLIASQALFANNQYRAKVITQKTAARNQLQDNTKAYDRLVNSYRKFDSKSTNVLGGTISGTNNLDGNNATIVLDSLPSSYDFPALTSSLEKIVRGKGFIITSMTGLDDQVKQESANSPDPKPVAMPFTFTVEKSNFPAVEDLIKTLETSIRPFQADEISMKDTDKGLSMTFTGHTYFQPSKNLTITKKVVK